MNNQKMIKGKYVSEDGTSFTYVSPLNDFVDITGNIIEDNFKNGSLLANKGYDLLKDDKTLENQSLYEKEITLWDSRYQETNFQPITAYDRMGISVKFLTKLKGLKTKGGTYGIRLDVNVSTTTTGNIETSDKKYSFYLTNKDCFGDPYNFETYYTQEKLFDVSEIINLKDNNGATTSKITAMRLVAFQNQDFYNDKNAPLVYREFNPVTEVINKDNYQPNIYYQKENDSYYLLRTSNFNEVSGQQLYTAGELLPDNIFIKDVYISFGYDLKSFNEDKILLGSLDGLTYSPIYDDLNNKKDIYFRWVHKQDDNKIIAIDKNEEALRVDSDIKIHWYRYRLAEKVSNELAGCFWSEIMDSYIDENSWNNIETQLRKEYNEHYYSKPVFEAKIEQMRSQIESNAIWQKNDNLVLNDKDYFNYSILPDTSIQSEMFKIIIEYPSKESIINSLINDNKEFDNIVNGFFSNERGFDDDFRKYLTNITHDGSEEAYKEFLAIYAKDKNSPLYTDDLQAEIDLYDEEALANYLWRVENREQFQKVVDMVTTAFGGITYLYSDTLTFQNEQLCANPSTIDLIKGLNIICDPVEKGGYGGVYFIYDSTNNIMNNSEASKRRTLTASYSSLVTGEQTLDKASQIQWLIPLNNTMIQHPEEGIEYTSANRYDSAYAKWQSYIQTYGANAAETLEQKNVVLEILRGYATSYPELKSHINLDKLEIDKEGLEILRSKTFCTYDETSNPGFGTITRTGTENYTDIEIGKAQQIEIDQIFRIKNYYIASANNNTIYCRVIKNNQIFEAEISLSFGTAGTNGTDVTFKLDMQDMDGTPISFMPFENGSQIQIVPKLFNFENQEMDISDKRISWSWYSGVTTRTNDDKLLTDALKAQEAAQLVYDEAKKEYFSLTDAEKEIGANGTSSSQADEQAEAARLKAIVDNYFNKKKTYEDANKVLLETQNNTHYYIELPNNAGSYPANNGNPITLKMPKAVSWNGVAHHVLQASLTYGVTQGYEQVFLGTDEKGEPIPKIGADGEYVYERKEKDVTLTTYLPIAIGDKNSKEGIRFAALPTTVVYDMSSSNPAYYKNNFYLYNQYNVAIPQKDINWYYIIQENGNTLWSANNPCSATESQYYPTFKENDGEITLRPQTMFFNNGTGLGKGYSIVAKNSANEIVWLQPVLIMQNRFSSPMLNNWDGSLTIDEENGTIMSATIGAGIKNPDNSFSGVLMGDVETKASAAKGIGLYGYDYGNQSFGFNVNGTAFLGQAGKGRINFNGNKGIITSGNYSRYNTGMKIDLNSGISNNNEGSSLAMYGSFGNIQQGIEMDTTNKNILRIFATPYSGGSDIDGESEKQNLQSGSKKDLLLVGIDNYFLQTLNFDSSAQTGTKIDLKNGKITSYNFAINAVKNNTGIQINSNGQPYLNIKQMNNSKQVDVVNITRNAFTMQSPNFQEMEYTTTTESQQVISGNDDKGNPIYKTIETEVINVTTPGTGMRINMAQPKIDAYSFTLMAQKNNDPKQFIKISSSGSCPFNISNNFKIGWDGSFKNNSFSINADGSLNINNCFVVDKDGNLTIKNPGDDEGFFKVSNNGAVNINNKFQIDKFGNVNINNRLVLLNDGAIGIGSNIINGYTRDDNGNTTFKTGEGEAPFWVDQNGNMHSERGTIGGWIIGPTTLTSDSVEGKALVLSAKGANRISIGTIVQDESGDVTGSTGNAFQVSAEGYMTATGATLYSANIYGKITAASGMIGGWTISANQLQAGNTVLSSSGKITCNDLQATGGKIGGVTISSGGLTATGFSLTSDGLTCKQINGYVVDVETAHVCTGYNLGHNAILNADFSLTCAGYYPTYSFDSEGKNTGVSWHYPDWIVSGTITYHRTGLRLEELTYFGATPPGYGNTG